MNPKRCIEVGHVEFIAGGLHFVMRETFLAVPFPRILADALQSQHPRLVFQYSVGQCQHAAFSGRDIFIGVKTERHRMTMPTNFLSAIARAHRMRPVFNDDEVMPLCNVRQTVEVAGVTGKMNRQKKSCARRDALFDFFRINIERTRFNIDEHRFQP